MDTATSALQPTSVYIYRDNVGTPLQVGITTRGLRRQQEFAESKVWWPLVATCQVMHCYTRDEAIEIEQELLARFQPPFNSEDKRMALARYYGCSPVVELAPAAEVRRNRLRWRALPKAMKPTVKCVQCDDRMALELLDGDCGLCHMELKSKNNTKRQDGKSWGKVTAGVKRT